MCKIKSSSKTKIPTTQQNHHALISMNLNKKIFLSDIVITSKIVFIVEERILLVITMSD